MSVKELLEGTLYTAFIWSAPGLYAIALVYLAVLLGSIGANGMIGLALGLSPILIAWYIICGGRKREELQRLLKPTRFPTEKEWHEAIEYLVRTKGQRSE